MTIYKKIEDCKNQIKDKIAKEGLNGYHAFSATFDAIDTYFSCYNDDQRDVLIKRITYSLERAN